MNSINAFRPTMPKFGAILPDTLVLPDGHKLKRGLARFELTEGDVAEFGHLARVSEGKSIVSMYITAVPGEKGRQTIFIDQNAEPVGFNPFSPTDAQKLKEMVGKAQLSVDASRNLNDLLSVYALQESIRGMEATALGEPRVYYNNREDDVLPLR